MALSKSSRITILLVIDTAFFLLELSIGYAVHSLALVADAFHMLNDVLSLCVGLWAVKVANQKMSSRTYTYGWQRAETLGALVNGVFLVALCVTIFLDAIQRFVEPQEVSNPKLVLIVGCLGLASNILGLFLFHDHSHGPGGHSHGPEGHSHDERDAEEGHAHAHNGHKHVAHVADESGNVADVLPQNRIANWPKTEGAQTEASESSTAVESPKYAKHKHTRSKSRGYSSFEDIQVNPSAFRKSIIEASRLDALESDEGTGDEAAVDEDRDDAHGHSHTEPLLKGNGKKHAGYGSIKRKSIDHRQHKHAQPKEQGKGHGHSHGDLNMRGIFLHVMGDALGNVGVIATALIIWLTDYSWRYYFDPAISLVITIIILGSAIPLCKAASRILLQAVPIGINVDDIKDDIEDLPGIISCHHVHVWQLSDTKLVGSLHVQVGFDFKDEGSARYMQLAQSIRHCLHEYGIHSSTIQPEFCLDPEHDHVGHNGSNDGGDHHEDVSPSGSAKRSKPNSKAASKAGSVREPDACLLECGDECGDGKTCCEPLPKDDGSDHGHSH
ncbi:zinc/cadmium resistance protein [Hortaea werneckii]|nr:zinc/cadmium resistance protein [Hortaea werneckii]